MSAKKDRFDPLVFADGSAVDTATWPQRRQEMRDVIVPAMYGGMPPAPDDVSATLLCDATVRGTDLRMQTYEIRCRVGDGEVSIPLYLWIPKTGGDGPRPVLLDGDGCWRYFNDDIVRRVTERGYIAASFDRTALAADNKDVFRETGLYRLLPQAEFGALSAWAWGYHRCVDALMELDDVQSDAIAITGHSRGGKTVILAAATDERIAMVNPNASGTGGVAPNHLKAPPSEYVADFFRSGNIFWFGQDFADHRGRDAELPYEQHWMHALVAPRPLLVTEGYDDDCANPAGSYASCQAALPVYAFLGAEGALGWAYREGGHDHSAHDFEALLSFMDREFAGRTVKRDFQRSLYPDLEQILSPPTSG